MAFRNLREAEGARDRADDALVRRIAIGVHEHDRDRIVALALRVAQRGAHGFRIGRRLDRSVRQHALVDLDDARIELLGLLDRAREDAGARLVADLERVAEAARRHQKRALAAPLQERIGRNRRSHLDGANCARRDRLAGSETEKAPHALDRRVRIGGALGQKLHGNDPPARVAPDHVGEGAAPIDPKVPGPGRRPLRRAALRVHV